MEEERRNGTTMPTAIAARSNADNSSIPVPSPPLSPKNIKGKRRARRREKEMERESKQKSAFHRLPREIIQQILYVCEPNTFDSLTLLNSEWYRASRSAHLYAHQLQSCNINVTIDLDDRPETLSSLVYQFGVESRRGLFESMLRPRVTELQLICNSLSSSGAPGGEAFRYEFSPKGTYVLAISSSRLFVIDLSTPSGDLPVTVKRELKLMRRPNAAAILDDGSMMVVLSSSHKVSLYDLTGPKVKMTQSLDLENEPRTIALSPGAAVLALAYEGGVEVISLRAESLGMSSSRSVKCETVDSLFFSLDGTVLMGSTLSSTNPVTVVISAPFFSQDMPVSDLLSQMWTTQILFPRSSRDNSHATLLPHAGESSSWTVTYDKVFASFRAVRVDDLRNGYTYFTAPATDSLPPSTLPAPSNDGGIVAAGFGSRSVFIYGVPSSLENTNEHDNGSGHASSNSSNSGNGADLDLGATHTPQWQHVASDRFRNVFVNGKKVGDVDGLLGVKFTRSIRGERLVAVAAGVDTGELDEEGNPLPLGGGRIVFFDFVRGPSVSEKDIVTIEVGDGSLVPLEKLEEQQVDMDTEVSIVRRRTVAARRGRGGDNMPPMPSSAGGPSLTRAPSTAVRPNVTARSLSPNQVAAADNEDRSDDDEEEVMDQPYAHGEMRSINSLQRAATAAAAAAARTPRRRPEAANEPSASVTNYRLLGLREEPWIEPPPPYAESAVTTVLYDYHERLAERAATMGISNPDARVHFQPSGVERSNTAPELSEEGSPRIGRAGSTRSIVNRAGSMIRRNAPSLRITSPVSPINPALAGEISMGGSVSAGAGPSYHPFVNPAFQNTPAVTSANATSAPSPNPTLHPPRTTSLAPHSPSAIPNLARDLPPVPSGLGTTATVQPSTSSSPPRRRAPEPFDSPREHVRSTRVPQPSFSTQPGSRPSENIESRPNTAGSRSNSSNNQYIATPGSPRVNYETVAVEQPPPPPQRQQMSPPPMLSRLPSHRVPSHTNTATSPALFPPADMDVAADVSQPHLPLPPQPQQVQVQVQQRTPPSSPPQLQAPLPPLPQESPVPPQPPRSQQSTRPVQSLIPANYQAPLPPIPQQPATRLAQRRSNSRRNRRSHEPPYVNPQFMDNSERSQLTPANLNLAQQRLSRDYHNHHSPSPGGIRRSPAGSYGHGSVRRQPSRAERSAARNVRDMKAKKKAAKRAASASVAGDSTMGRRGSFDSGKGGGRGLCVIM